MRTESMVITLLAVGAGSISGQVGQLTEGGRVLGFEPTMGVLVAEDTVTTVRQGRTPTFSPSGDLRVISGSREFRSWSDDWTTVIRGGTEVRYHNDDDMRRFRDSFYLNGRVISPGYPVTAVQIDADGRIWAGLHAVSEESKRWRTAWKVFSVDGVELFSVETPSRESVVDAHGDRVLFVRNVQRDTVEFAVRRLSPDLNSPDVIR